MSGARDTAAYDAPRILERTKIDLPLIGTGGGSGLPCAAIK